ncbi:YopX family protein [Campylobacter coli]
MKLSEFDFRVWDGKKYINNIKGGVYIHKINDHIKCLNRNQDCYDYEFELDELDNSNLEIELFTGYYDYKGNKIYIGDIIECLVFTNEKNSEIFYEIICFDMELGLCSKLSNGDGGYLFDLRRHKNNKTIEDVYVVGNIHENKELLKGRK